MSLIDKIQKDSLAARKAGDSIRSALLITLYSEAAMIGKNAGNRETTDGEVVAVVRKFLKGVDESLAVVKDESKVSVLKIERDVLNGFLPTQMSESEITQALESIIGELNVTREPKSMGLLMKELKARFEGRYDGTKASALVKSVLAGTGG